MPNCFTGITEVQPYHNPNEGKDIWNRNFQILGCAINSLISSSNTGNTIVTNGDNNIQVSLSGLSTPPIYAIYLSDDIVLNSINSSIISGNTIYSGGTDLYDIFGTGGGVQTTASNGLTKSGDNITLGGSLTANTTINVNSNYLRFLNTNPTTVTGDYKFRFLDGVTTPTDATKNVSVYSEFKPVTTDGSYQFTSGNVMYADPSGSTNSEFWAGGDLLLVGTDLGRFNDRIGASLSVVSINSSTGTIQSIYGHSSAFQNNVSGSTIQDFLHYEAYGNDGANASVIENVYGFYMRNSTNTNITNKWGVYIDDVNAKNYFAGDISGNTMNLTSTSTAQLVMEPVNVAAPANGSVWFTTSGGTTLLNYQVSGVTKSVELS